MGVYNGPGGGIGCCCCYCSYIHAFLSTFGSSTLLWACISAICSVGLGEGVNGLLVFSE